MTLQRYVSHAFNQDDPAVLACAISFIILSMQCLRTNLDQSELPIPAAELVDRYVSDIDRHVVSDDELSMSLEGIENILLQSQYYGNIGRPRKAWTIIRRGLSHSMLLGMHRCIVLPHAQSPYLKRQESVWWHLLEYGAINTSEAMSGSIFRRNLSIIVSAISQMSPEISPLSLPKTIEIDNQLRDLAHNMPPCWWDLVVPSRDNIPEMMDLNERMNAQIWFYQAQAYLHLPFIVEHIDNHSYEQNHEKCLQASHEKMKIYIMLREVLGATIYICRIIDFQTFTAAVILILGLLSRKHNITVDHSGQDKSDWNLIHQVVDAFRQVSVEDNNLTAVQCLQLLEKLVSMGKEAARSETHEDGKPAREPPVGSATEESLHIDIFNTPFLHRIVENCNMITQHPGSNQFPCHDTMATDIDQDWSWMLNEQYHSHS
ncbi:hypothetical protein L207DRAFT_642777 [Hyaloscypha variabilis F]|uniref:Transcription factor domain-containing protein n=1 Tax=Hyaloscypha variabilis (strain UAMH 11265 / GT02V1 / F) TaxID=1149755 RepID=A0A2J6QRJ1_HYAVF|nr:hypothetical protein L207DRAFT_642777 [Hyaloscypha variabilis F]